MHGPQKGLPSPDYAICVYIPGDSHVVPFCLTRFLIGSCNILPKRNYTGVSRYVSTNTLYIYIYIYLQYIYIYIWVVVKIMALFWVP